jgi:Carboxypeptidase regulatory-like domain
MWQALRRKIAPCMVALTILSLYSASGRAQSTTSAVSGSVTDSTGAIVIGASVVVTNAATGVAYSATTDNLGAYHVTQLPPGSYTLTVSKTGFETQNTVPFTLFVDQKFEQSITLGVGGTTQSVSVSADALLLDTQTSNQGQVIENQQIGDMPLNGRDVLQLAQLSAGVTPVVSGMSSPASQWTGTATVALVIGGLREDDVSYLYDGIETRNAWYGAAGLLPSPDFTQEFKVEQSGAPAAFGNGGAFVSVVTRSGTNQFHGSAYEYLRNNDFDARNYFDQGAPPPLCSFCCDCFVGLPMYRTNAEMLYIEPSHSLFPMHFHGIFRPIL